jgi:hypothetical protein
MNSENLAGTFTLKNLRPEEQLIIVCAQSVIEKGTSEVIKHLVETELDWTSVYSLAQQNFVMPLLCFSLLNTCPELLPHEVRRCLDEYVKRHVRNNLLQTSELLAAVRLLQEHGIPSLPLKGPTLSVIAYGGLSHRSFGDLDILVPKISFRKSVEVLRSAGYTSTTELGWTDKVPFLAGNKKDYGLFKNGGRTRVEVHWRLSGTHFGLPIDLRELWPRLTTIGLAGQSVNTLPTNELFLYLCTHGARHGWERLQWICDIAELVRGADSLDWDELFRLANRFGCERVLCLSLFLIRDLFGTEMPEWVIERVNSFKHAGELARCVYLRLFRNSDHVTTTGDWYRYHLGLKERKRDRLKLHSFYAYRYVSLLLRPNQRDHDLLDLPSSLSFLFYLVRPLRLGRDYGFSAVKRHFKGRPWLLALSAAAALQNFICN